MTVLHISWNSEHFALFYYGTEYIEKKDKRHLLFLGTMLWLSLLEQWLGQMGSDVPANLSHPSVTTTDTKVKAENIVK